MTRVVLITSAHSRSDTRIFLKQGNALSKKYDVSFLVSDGQRDEIKNGIQIVGSRSFNKRGARLLFSSFGLYSAAMALRADIYHLHDPELIPLGLKLKKKGKKVVFDCHESVARQILSKPYIPKLLRGVLSALYARVECWALSKFDLLIAATPTISNELKGMGACVVTVNNYPIEGELAVKTPYGGRPRAVAYIGGISEIRGVYELTQALELTSTEVTLNLVGDYSSPKFKTMLQSLPGWKNVNELGILSRDRVQETLSASRAGIVTFLPEPNHIESQPNKLFEYMSAGLPVIASFFPLWREIVEGSSCGLCVDPDDPKAIAVAIDWMLEHEDEAAEMGKRGNQAIRERYNWENESIVLLEAYRALIR